MISQNVWAPPFFFGPWVELENHTGDIAYTVYFDTLSNVPGPFIALSGMPLMGQEQLTLLVQHLIRSLARALVLIKLNLKVSVGQGRLFMYTLPYNKS